MKKNLLTLAFSILLAAQCLAQISFQNPSDYPRRGTFIDSVNVVVNANLPYPAEGADQVWDFGSIESGVILTEQYTDASGDTDFPGAINSKQNDLDFNLGGPGTEYTVQSRSYEGLDAQGWHTFGRKTDSFSVSLTSITGGATDRIDYLQTIKLDGGRVDFVKFPMAFGDAWNQFYFYDVEYELTAGALGLNATPAFTRYIYSLEREVVGSGSLIIPTADRTPSAPMDALLIKSRRTIIDSFFLGGAPTPASLLGVLGLTQGRTRIDSSYLFYAPGFGAQVMVWEDLDNGIANKVDYRTQAGRQVSSTVGFNIPPALSFPNPATAGTSISISLQQAANAGNMVFFNTTGQVVGEVPYNAGGETSFTIDLPATLPKGTLWYRVVDRSGKPLGVGKIQLL